MRFDQRLALFEQLRLAAISLLITACSTQRLMRRPCSLVVHCARRGRPGRIDSEVLVNFFVGGRVVTFYSTR
jgi:hypothetical protein